MSSVSDDLWPADIQSQEFLTPEEILKRQAEFLTKRTNGMVEGSVVREAVRSEPEKTRVVLRFEIVSARIGKRIKLFEAMHREDFEYPVSLVPPSDELPAYLKEKRYQPSKREIESPIEFKEKGSWIENDWIASSPIAFAEKVRAILEMASVKSAVVSLLGKSK